MLEIYNKGQEVQISNVFRFKQTNLGITSNV